VPQDLFTIAEAAELTGLPQSTLRYWERIGVVEPIDRDRSSGHRRYSQEDIQLLDTLGNLRAVGMTVLDMRRYLAGRRRGDESAGEQKALFEAHARRLADQMQVLESRRRYLELKVQYWAAREVGDLDKAEAVAEEIRPLINRINPKDST
jgi:MerR family transcriptional regulator, aldehyde-responsive regulator